MFALFSSSEKIERVVDVDIFDPVDVEWAITTKSQTSSDTMTVQRALFSKLDALSNDGISDEIGIGVTIALGADPFRFETIPIPDENSVRLKNYIDIPQCDPGDPGGKHSCHLFDVRSLLEPVNSIAEPATGSVDVERVRSGAMDEVLPNIGISAPAQAMQGCLCASGVLSGDERQPGRAGPVLYGTAELARERAALPWLPRSQRGGSLPIAGPRHCGWRCLRVPGGVRQYGLGEKIRRWSGIEGSTEALQFNYVCCGHRQGDVRLYAYVALLTIKVATNCCVTFKGEKTMSKTVKYPSWTKQFIGGEWKEGSSNRVDTVTSPYDGQTLTELKFASKQDIDDAYKIAKKVQPAWAAVSAYEKIAILGKGCGNLCRTQRRAREFVDR